MQDRNVKRRISPPRKWPLSALSRLRGRGLGEGLLTQKRKADSFHNAIEMAVRIVFPDPPDIQQVYDKHPIIACHRNVKPSGCRWHNTVHIRLSMSVISRPHGMTAKGWIADVV
jgi:hypothetical protein